MSMATTTKVTTVPLTIREAGNSAALLAQNIVEQAQRAGIGHSYGAWVGVVMIDSRNRWLLHPANNSPIGLVWPYCNRLRNSYSNDQIFLAVQIAIILEIGDRLDSNASAATAKDADASLRHSVTKAQIEARRIIEQLVVANPDGIDLGAALYQLGWFRKWDLFPD